MFELYQNFIESQALHFPMWESMEFQENITKAP